MKILFIGGTGLISNACARIGIAKGMDITVLNRSLSHRFPHPHGTKSIVADNSNENQLSAIIRDHKYDIVVDWIAYTVEDIARDIRIFNRNVGQFVFISSASAYQKPPKSLVITESTPLANPFWQYSRDKIACEAELMREYKETGFPITIVRPSLTYGEGQLPLVMNSWNHPFTIIDRIKRNKPIVVPGDGESLWVMTYNEDFAEGFLGLLGNPKAVGESYHITSEEVLSWNTLFEQFLGAIGLDAELKHVPVEKIIRLFPDFEGTLIGDKSNSVIFDNSKIRSLVPNFKCRVNWGVGIKRSYDWLINHPENQTVDVELNRILDRILESD